METNSEDTNLLARWLDKRLTKNEEKELAKQKELEALKIVIDDIDTWKLKKFDVENGLQKLQERKNNRSSKTIPLKKKSNTYWIGIAASLTLLISSYLLFDNFINTKITVSTSVAENKTIELPSGSKVYLDALSSVTYDKKEWENSRSIELNGQALFKVTKGNTFKVLTPNNASVTVLGTVFNVNTNNKKLSVNCYEGKVAVEFKNQKEILVQGQGVFLNNSTLLRQLHQNNSPDWQKGYSKYDQIGLTHIITDIQKYYPIKITLPRKYEELKFSGIIPHNNLQAALKTLFSPFEIAYQVKDNTVIFE